MSTSANQNLLSQFIQSKKPFGIIGIGYENKQFLNWLIHTLSIDPKRIYLADSNKISLPYPIEGFGGVFDESNYSTIFDQGLGLEFIFKTPGMWSLSPEFEEFRSINGKTSVLSPLVFFVERFRNQIIGVTGTKGKTTTSSLVKHCIESKEFGLEYQRVYGVTPKIIYTGNTTNTSPYQYWNDLNMEVDEHSYYVIELSSFQLQDLGYSSLSPRRSIITNYFVDHQDQHRTVEEYWECKNQIFYYQNTSDYLFITSQLTDKINLNSITSTVTLVDDDYATMILSSLSTSLVGLHNGYNIALALLCASSILTNNSQDSLESIATSLISQHPTIVSQFETLKHRLFRSGIYTTEIDLVFESLTKTYQLTLQGINDSQSTMPESVIAGIDGFTMNKNQFLWLILSGKDKGVEVDNLAKRIISSEVENQLYRVDYYGKIGNKVLNKIYSLTGSRLQSEKIESIRENLPQDLSDPHTIVNQFTAWLQNKINESYDIGSSGVWNNLMNTSTIELSILLSPCGSSFDEFNNAYERGDWFDSLIKNCFGV